MSENEREDEQPSEPTTPLPGSSGGRPRRSGVGGGKLGDAEDDRDE